MIVEADIQNLDLKIQALEKRVKELEDKEPSSPTVEIKAPADVFERMRVDK